MKQEFSTSWTASKQIRKQRKYTYNAPLHIKHKFLSTNLSKALRERYGKRNVSVRKGDEVLVVRGNFQGKKAKVDSIDLKNTSVILEGISRPKRDGSKVSVKFHPSNLQIQALMLEDKERISSLERKKKVSPEVSKEIKTENKSPKTTKEVQKEPVKKIKENKNASN